MKPRGCDAEWARIREYRVARVPLPLPPTGIGLCGITFDSTGPRCGSAGELTAGQVCSTFTPSKLKLRGCRGDDDAADTQYFFGGDGEGGMWSTTSATSHHMCSRAACRSNSHDRLHGWQQRHQRHERHQQPMACAGSIPAQCSAAAALASERGRSSSCSSSGSSSSSNRGGGSSSSSSRGGRGTATRLYRLPQLLLGCTVLCSTQSVCEVPECLCALCGCPWISPVSGLL